MRDRTTAQQRARELVGKMTLEEKASQLKYDAPAIPRLGVPAGGMRDCTVWREQELQPCSRRQSP